MKKNGNIGYKILHIENAVECRIVGRINRFVLKIRLAGDYYRGYLNNTGRLYQFLVEGRKAFCLGNEKQGKTDYRLFSVEEGDLGAIVDTQLQMKAFEKSLDTGLVPWLKGCKIRKRNATLGDSLIDYLLECDKEKIYLEVKSAVLRENQHALYPDCPSLRGRKHIRRLINHVREGGEAIVLFIAALPRVRAFKPNKYADPELYELLRAAHRIGVKIKSMCIVYNPKDSFIYLVNPELAVDLS